MPVSTPAAGRPRHDRKPVRRIVLLLALLAAVVAGCTIMPTEATKVSLGRVPSVVATAQPDSGIVPLAVTFSGAASDSGSAIASYLWNFGDGGSSRVLNTSHTYRAAGDYTATLVATDDQGKTASSSVRIRAVAVANQPPMVTIMASPASGAAPLAVSFMADGSDADGTVVSYEWTFGDGSGASVQNPTHTFTSPGTYMVHVTATDDGGAAGTDMASVSVTTSANRAPTATASATPTSGTTPLTVTFAGAGTDSDGSIASYAWTFGDGGTSTLQSPSHTYTTAGSFTAMLMVTDDQGATGSANVMIMASATANVAPTATATATPTTGTAPLAVAFTGTGRDTDGTIASWAWTFGDGGTSAAQNPAHTYSAAGSYSAQLTVTDNQGATGSASVTITVTTPANSAPLANAGPDQLNKDPGTTVLLTGAASSDPGGAIASYAWTQVAGPAVTLTGANTATPSFVGVAKTTTTYRFRLSVTDNGSPALSAVDTVAVGTRITYANLVGPLLLARGTQPSGQLLGCTSSGCHSGANGLSPLSTYAQVFSARSGTRSRISPGGSMLKFLLSGEAPYIIGWIDAGAPEKN